MAQEKHSGISAKTSRRTGLGKGLGALIPQIPTEEAVAQARPIDAIIPANNRGSSIPRGGSARDLLSPRPKKTSGSVATTSPLSSSHKKKAQFSDSGATSIDETKNSSDLVAGTVISQKATETTSQQNIGKSQLSEEKSGNVSRETLVNEEDLPTVPGATYAELPLNLIIPNSRQPRTVFDEDELEELVASIKEVGVLQPVIVRPLRIEGEISDRLKELIEAQPEARFELIMGERRLRSCERAGLETIPAIIRETEDEDLLRDALLENLHRAQLNPLEEAAAYQQLMADFGATQEELSRKIARSRPQITNTLRLLKLPPTVQNKVAAQVISAGHARALLSLNDSRDMEILADRIVAEGLSVRTTEELVRLGRVKAAPTKKKTVQATLSPLAQNIMETLADIYETRVTVTEGRTKGKITIEFAGKEDLQRIADLIRGRQN
ncbi:ParB/RepB/Spo0J family partition protein [Schaalia sp. lx-260]|uniref:ParB/RepB/Spo0J family partition protein n=1 Tax=Schaalia sp. lx-260 TaxID=2899082 RepID=UPI001E5CE431|nr:ParB/RepB/Spo0J family partition protein [Schaalia sp. lx-260]MCD4550090.1 ParB/RepB/Spo0J family partition protein [Schaalia sp. lx-260]